MASSPDQAVEYLAYIGKDWEIKWSSQKDKYDWLERKAELAEDAAAQYEMLAFSLIAKKVTGGSRTRSGPIKVKDDTLLSSGEDKLTKWAEHFNEVLNRPAQTISTQAKDLLDTLPISTEKFTEVEVRKATRALKNSKSPGVDRISAEMLNAGGETVILWIPGLCNPVWESEVVPDDWKNGTIVSIPQKATWSTVTTGEELLHYQH